MLKYSLLRGILHTPKEEDAVMNELMKQYTFGVEIEFTGMSRKSGYCSIEIFPE